MNQVREYQSVYLRAKYDSMSKKERESAHRRKRAADPNQQSKTGAAKPTYVSTDKPKKKKKKNERRIYLHYHFNLKFHKTMESLN